jgi:hypothetical protein
LRHWFNDPRLFLRTIDSRSHVEDFASWNACPSPIQPTAVPVNECPTGEKLNEKILKGEAIGDTVMF